MADTERQKPSANGFDPERLAFRRIKTMLRLSTPPVVAITFSYTSMPRDNPYVVIRSEDSHFPRLDLKTTQRLKGKWQVSTRPEETVIEENE
jgi:hypothetical protein